MSYQLRKPDKALLIYKDDLTGNTTTLEIAGENINGFDCCVDLSTKELKDISEAMNIYNVVKKRLSIKYIPITSMNFKK